MTLTTPETLTKLKKLDTPTICNLVELFEVRPHNTGFMDARIQAGFPEMPAIVGFAATATFRASAPPRSGDVYSSMVGQAERFAELPGPAIVVFQDLDQPTVAATFGEVMCTVYQSFGAAGLITSGAGRDLDQVRRMGFPVWTGGTICAHGYCHVVQVHVPVHVGGIAIYPGDLIHADCNGVTTIPVEIADELADAGPEFMAAEAIIIEGLRQGTPTIERLRELNAAKNDCVDKMRKRLSRVRH